MSEKLTKVVVNCATGVAEVIELTAQETAQRDQDAAAAAEERSIREAQEMAKAAARASAIAKLAALGLTAEEVSSLL
jgi:adenylate kinase